MRHFIVCMLTIILSMSLCVCTVDAKKNKKKNNDKTVHASQSDFSLTGSTDLLKETKVVLYTQEDLRYLASIIYAEARNQCYEGKVAVGQVVLNRVADKDFPSTVKKVIYDPGCGQIQFTPVANGAYAKALRKYKNKNKVMKECVRAAKDAFNGKNVIGDKLYFHVFGSGEDGMDLDSGNWSSYLLLENVVIVYIS